MNQEQSRKALAWLSVTLLSAMVAACGGGAGASSPSSTPVASPSPPASAPSPSAPASVASADLPVPNWSQPNCDQSSGDLSPTAPTLASSSESETAQALFQKLNAARTAMCAGYLAHDSSGVLDGEALSRANATLNTKVSSPGFADFGGFAVPTGYDGATFDAGIDALDANGLEVVQLAPVRVWGGGYTGQSPQQRITSFAALQDADTRVLVSALHDTSAAAAQRCTNELLSQPAQRERLLDPRFRQLGAGYGALLSRYFDIESQWEDTADAICFAVSAASSATYGTTGLATAPTGWVGVWPPQGSDVPFTDIHARGAVDGTRHGYPASIAVDSHYALTVQSFTIRDVYGNVVPSTIGLDALPDAAFQNWAFVTPLAPLALNAKYIVHFVGSANGVVIDRTWTFSTPILLPAFDPRNS